MRSAKRRGHDAPPLTWGEGLAWLRTLSGRQPGQVSPEPLSHPPLGKVNKGLRRKLRKFSKVRTR
jgi:hypothetical protein